MEINTAIVLPHMPQGNKLFIKYLNERERERKENIRIIVYNQEKWEKF